MRHRITTFLRTCSSKWQMKSKITVDQPWNICKATWRWVFLKSPKNCTRKRLLSRYWSLKRQFWKTICFQVSWMIKTFCKWSATLTAKWGCWTIWALIGRCPSCWRHYSRMNSSRRCLKSSFANSSKLAGSSLLGAIKWFSRKGSEQTMCYW